MNTLKLILLIGSILFICSSQALGEKNTKMSKVEHHDLQINIKDDVSYTGDYDYDVEPSPVSIPPPQGSVPVAPRSAPIPPPQGNVPVAPRSALIPPPSRPAPPLALPSTIVPPPNGTVT